MSLKNELDNLASLSGMFPTLDKDTILNILRSNKHNVDDAIDALLAVTAEKEDASKGAVPALPEPVQSVPAPSEQLLSLSFTSDSASSANSVSPASIQALLSIDFSAPPLGEAQPAATEPTSVSSPASLVSTPAPVSTDLSAESKRELVSVRVKHEFVAPLSDARMVSVPRGCHVVVIDRFNDDWVRVEFDGRRGLFPVKYLDMPLVEEPAAEPTQREPAATAPVVRTEPDVAASATPITMSYLVRRIDESNIGVDASQALDDQVRQLRVGGCA
eukprot:TRINITY_DN2272_c0_g1_i2.p1 TRINITY_DN2272_c0_g1~~TRINITY_DN2272_c0_g1_i2.p1  ORF type:complete len:307 (-),score=82.05 TRINITY_DN2272_c0_g1_i2:433-1254(-)